MRGPKMNQVQGDKMVRRTVLCVVGIFFGCQPANDVVSGAAPPVSKVNQLVIRDELVSGVTGISGLGSDCGQGGAAACSTGQCLHSGVFPNDVYVCSQLCSVDDDCPDEWRCLAIEGLRKSFCAAPTMKPGWKFGAPKTRVVNQRSTSRPVRPTTVNGVVDGGGK
jgi:hypothetical protein